MNNEVNSEIVKVVQFSPQIIQNQGLSLAEFLEGCFFDLNCGDEEVIIPRFLHRGKESDERLIYEKNCMLIILNPAAHFEGAMIRFVGCSKAEIEEVIMQVFQVGGGAIDFVHFSVGSAWGKFPSANRWFQNH